MVRIGPIRISPKPGLLALLGVLWCSADPVAGQTIRGRVLEQGSELPIPTAGVTLIDEKGAAVANAIADSSGNFAIRPPQPGKYWVRAQRIGYVNKLTPVIDIGLDSQAETTIRLEIRGDVLDALRVRENAKRLEIGRSQFARRCAETEAICIRQARIKASRVTFPNDIFESIPGMAVLYNRTG